MDNTENELQSVTTYPSRVREGLRDEFGCFGVMPIHSELSANRQAHPVIPLFTEGYIINHYFPLSVRSFWLYNSPALNYYTVSYADVFKYKKTETLLFQRLSSHLLPLYV